MSVLDRTLWYDSPLADLHAIASELSIDGFRRLRRADLITAILKEGWRMPEQGRRVLAARPRRTRGRRRRGRERPRAAAAHARGGRTRSGADAAEETDEAAETAEVGAGGRRPGRRRGRGGGAAQAPPVAFTEAESRPGRGDRGRDPGGVKGAGGRAPRRRSEPPRACAARGPRAESRGRDGRGTERRSSRASSSCCPTARASSASPARPVRRRRLHLRRPGQALRAGLRRHDRRSQARPRRSERFASLIRIETINGRPASELADSVRFDDLPAALPTDRLKIGSEDPTLKAIEWLTPFGRGSRVTIVGGSRAGKTEALRRLASAGRHRGADRSVALAGVRPEEISEWHRGPVSARRPRQLRRLRGRPERRRGAGHRPGSPAGRPRRRCGRADRHAGRPAARRPPAGRWPRPATSSTAGR